MNFKGYPHIWDKKIGTIMYDDGKIYFEYDDAFWRRGKWVVIITFSAFLVDYFHMTLNTRVT